MIAKEFKQLSDAEAIAHVAPLFIRNYKETGVLASVSLAQFIYESDYGKSELAQRSNNVFGMKTSISGNTWSGSVWDGRSFCSIVTAEMDAAGKVYRIPQDFRAYDSIESSVTDHGRYLLHAMNGDRLRYEGIHTAAAPAAAAKILLSGDYSTFSNYADTLLRIIRVWNLTRFDRSI